MYMYMVDCYQSTSVHVLLVILYVQYVHCNLELLSVYCTYPCLL